MLLELMNFIYHRYASIKISYARQNQYKTDLLAFLVHLSEFSHYFINQKISIKQFLIFQNDNIEYVLEIIIMLLFSKRLVFRSKFLEYGNGILSAIVLVTCPCDLLYEQLQNIVHQSTKLLTKLNWLNIIRPDWFDMNYEIRVQVQTFLTMKNIVETQQNNFPVDMLVSLVIENSELDSYQSIIIQLIMKNEQWELINLFVKHQRDWSFMRTPSTKVKTFSMKVLLRFIYF
jgi:hypothetical protein